MKSWLKALLISVVVLAGCIVYLPTLAKQGINSLLPWVMEKAKLEQGHAHLSQLSWHTLKISEVGFQLPSNNSQIALRDIEISFSPWSLAAGRIKDVSIEYAQVTITPSDKPTETLATAKNRRTTINNSISPKNDNQPITRENTVLELTSLEEVFKQLPLDTLTVKQFQLQHPQLSVDSQLAFSKQQLTLYNSIQSDRLNKDLRHELIIDHKGGISSLTFIEQQAVPIFNLSANWLMPSDLSQPAILTLQQSADIQSWLSLLEQQDRTQSLDAKVAIQAWNLTLKLPTVINDPQALLTQLSATSFLQLKIEDFKVFDRLNNKPILDNASLDISLNANIDHQREEQWKFSLDTFDLAGDIVSLVPTHLKIKQQLKDALLFTCVFKIEGNTCQWQGTLAQQLTGDQLSHKTELELVGQYSQALNDTAKFYSQQILNLDTQQKNSLWPKFTNTSQGEIIVQGQQHENNWHWQVSLPHGLNNQSHYLEALFPEKTEATLSAIHWQLLPDWLIEGIDGELTQAKDFSVIIEQLNWQHKKEKLALENAQVSCNLDWLKLQYSPQLRSQQALSQLPLACHWQVKNKQTHWNQWPVPSLLFKGKFDLSSIDVKHAKLTAAMKLTGLAKSLDLTLLAQHDFNHLQQGSAQLYLNNLKLDWQQMGLIAMADLTEAQLLNGSLSAQGWVQWQQYQADIFDDNSIAWRWQPDLMLRIDDMSGIYQELTTWEDIDVQLAIRRPFYDDFRIDSQVSALSINPGINIENILARSTTTIESDFSQALVVIEEVHTDVLGGRINVPLIRYDTRQEVNAFGIEVEGLQLEQLAALESDSGVTATGRLDGVLPIILLPEGPQVPAGSLYARAPGGVVQFRGATADSLKQSDPSVSLAMQVLNDFRYDKLQTDVTYQPDGELNLGLQFQGYNPTFFDGQATHFNLNLEYNLLDLLESLRVSNDIVQKLENKYQ
jgi:hypothetical protein